MLRSFEATNEGLNVLIPLKCSISTMTICGKLSSTIRIADIAKRFIMDDILESHGLALPVRSDKKKKPASFFNQLTLKSGTTSLKLFTNGAVQCTGAKSPIHFLDVVDRVCSALGAMQEMDPPVLESATISMINAIFSAGRDLPMRVLRLALEADGHRASYDPDSYPGINAKVCTSGADGRDVTVMIFSTGSVILSGAKCPEHVSEAYGIVCKIIDALPATKSPLNKKCKQSFSKEQVDSYNIIGGYPARVAHLCIGS
jgi:TATA-box binding protein (TBP) (component of TFIID and TFIIIB)